MVGKDIKGEARRKLALNMHQAIIVYTIELTIFITLLALVVLACVVLGSAVNNVAAIVMICYGSILFVIAFVASGMVNFAMTDFYLLSYKCQPYNIRRLGDTIARSNITKVFLMSLKRTIFAILLLLCLIVPGVIYLIRTSMAPYLLIANPKMKPTDALTASNKVMSGKTGMYFSLIMSLIGWYILGILTLGLGYIFIAPYINLVKTVFYKRNLQGDRAEYAVTAQTAPPVYGNMVPPQPQHSAGQATATAQAQIDPQGPAPIDALPQDDVLDMQSAMQDFGVADIDSIPEVPLGAPTKNQDKNIKNKPAPEENYQAQEDNQESQSRKIDGTGLVETERILSTQEIDASDEFARTELEHMYNNAERQRPAVNYFDINGGSSDSDFDDFGVTPVADGGATMGQAEDSLSAQPVADLGESEPIMSDSDFDEFLRNFDAGESNDTSADVETQAQPPLKEEQSANTANSDRRIRTSDMLAHAESRARDRADSARVVKPIVATRGDLSERAERLKREREERLKNLNKK